MQAKNEWIIAEKIAKEKVLESGLIIPDTVADHDSVVKYRIMSIGEKVVTGGSVKVGDVVLHPNRKPNVRTVDGQDLYFIKLDNVLGVVED